MAPEEILELDCAVLFPQCTLSFFFLYVLKIRHFNFKLFLSDIPLGI